MKNKNNYLRTNAKKQAYKNKGITLIALIITIIVMLILVGVSVSILINSNLIGAAEKTATAYDEARRKEANSEGIIINGKTIDSYITLPEIEAGTRATEPSEYKSNNKTAVIPAGFTVSGISTEQSIDGGLVIYDIPEGTTVNWTNPDSVRTQYNQFVWIPVEVNKTTEQKDTETSIASFKRSVWQDNARVANNAQSSTSFPSSSFSWRDYTEPYSRDSRDYDGTGTGKTGISAQITELTKSIYKYGGFYIGRYEAGSETARTIDSLQTEAFVVQQDKYPYNYVKWGKGMGDISEGAVHLSNNLYPENSGYGVKSMLCTGAAWDGILDFIKDCGHNVTSSNIWGNYDDSVTYQVYRGSLYDYSIWSEADRINGSDVTKDTNILLTTGATERNSSKNIYDVAGNCDEWTTEANSTVSRVIRGWRFLQQWLRLSSKFPSRRKSTNIVNHNSFRPLLLRRCKLAGDAVIKYAK